MGEQPVVSSASRIPELVLTMTGATAIVSAGLVGFAAKAEISYMSRNHDNPTEGGEQTFSGNPTVSGMIAMVMGVAMVENSNAK